MIYDYDTTTMTRVLGLHARLSYDLWSSVRLRSELVRTSLIHVLYEHLTSH